MALLNPTPITLGLASPAIGPWFQTNGGGALPTLIAPSVDLSVPITLPAGMQWCAPAGCTSSYFIVTSPPPAGIARLRQADGTTAFAPNALIVLVTLLPEVEVRLAVLSNLVPTPNGGAVAAGQTGRPPVRHFAMEVPAAAAGNMSAIALLREAGFPSDLTSPEEQADYIGLTFDGGVAGNAKKPTSELHRPSIPVLGSSDEVILENRTGAPLAVKLWAFDDRGRALDPGAVANWWAFMASGSILPGDPLLADLWADPIGSGRQQTATVNGGLYVLFCNPHEGPVSQTLMGRLTLTGLTAVSGSTQLYSAAGTAAIALTAAPAPDNMPMPRLALLPTGPYGAPGAVALFNGWRGGAWPTNITRDFARIAVTDIESDLVGLTRITSTPQADPDLRVIAAANTAAAPALTFADAATAVAMTSINAGAAAVAMAPVMDRDWGAITPPAFGANALPNTLQFAVHALRGEGTAAGSTVSGQRIVVRFPPGSLRAGAWVRVWPHGLDDETGERFRLDGGGGLADGTGQAFVVTALPDGDGVSLLSFDALVVNATTSTYYLEQRFDRPSLDTSGGRVPLPAPPGLPAGFAPWMCEQGALMPRTTFGGLLGGGVTVLGLPANLSTGTYALIDLTTLTATDVVPATLRRAAGAGDQLIVTEPAYLNTLEGDLTVGAGPNGSVMLRRARNKFLDDLFDASAPVGDITVMGRPAPTMERREVFAVDPVNAAQTGVVGGISARAIRHEAIPAQLGHPGVPAANEIHGTGVALAGPVMVPLVQLMRERAASNLVQFVVAASNNIAPTPPPAGTTTFAAVLETLTFGVTGDGFVRAMLQAGTFQPGQTWDQWKAAIEARFGDIDQFLNPVIADDTLASALDRVVLKTRDGAAQAATALLAAIARAEDFVYLETPAIDPLSSGGGASDPVGVIDLVTALKTRLSQRPGLVVILCVPERFLPGQPSLLEEIRTAGVNAALKSLVDAAPDNVELFTPIAGSGRRLYMASTTVIVDDVFMLTGTTHLWRRGLTFDSSLAVALFDDALVMGRPATVRAARLLLVANRLGLPVAFSPTDAAHVLDAVRRLNATSGLLRVRPGTYVPAVDQTSVPDRDAWNPDGRPGGISDWFLFFAELAGGLRDQINNAIR